MSRKDKTYSAKIKRLKEAVARANIILEEMKKRKPDEFKIGKYNIGFSAKDESGGLRTYVGDDINIPKTEHDIDINTACLIIGGEWSTYDDFSQDLRNGKCRLVGGAGVNRDNGELLYELIPNKREDESKIDNEAIIIFFNKIETSFVPYPGWHDYSDKRPKTQKELLKKEWAKQKRKRARKRKRKMKKT